LFFEESFGINIRYIQKYVGVILICLKMVNPLEILIIAARSHALVMVSDCLQGFLQVVLLELGHDSFEESELLLQRCFRVLV